MTSLDIETTVETDIRSLLTAAGVTNVYAGLAARTGTATAVGVLVERCVEALPGGAGPTGYRRVSVSVDASGEVHDDATGSTLQALVHTVRDCLQTDDLISRLNTASSYATYCGWTLDSEERQIPDGRRRAWVWSLTLVMMPSNATTTTTTTTTSTTTGV